MADLLNTVDLSTVSGSSEVLAEGKVPYNLRNHVLEFNGTGIDASDATLAWEYSNDGSEYYPVLDDTGTPIVVTIVQTAGVATGVIDHQSFPGEYHRVVYTKNSVTAGSLKLILGGLSKAR